jgi:uncharacterized protein (DUF58 family)
VPTRQGWVVVAAAVAAIIAARVFAMIELYVAAAAVIGLVLVCWIYVRAVPLRLRVTRTLTPSRVHAGDTTRVEVSATNRGARTPVLRLRDPVQTTRGALLQLAPLHKGETARAAYRLPTARRGVVAVGPLAVEVGDPFGLASRSLVAAPILELTIYPHVDLIAAPSAGGERDPHGSMVVANAMASQGEEFFALREYIVGDDLRRVHWPSTARNDELMVRQDELPWQDRTTVMLDVRGSAHSGASFERAVSAAASVVRACFRHHHLVRFLATDGTDSGVGTGLAHVEGIMEYLAVVEPEGGGSMRSAIEAVRRTSPGGVLVAVLGRATSFETEAIAHFAASSTTVLGVVTEPPVPPAIRRGVKFVDATVDGRFAESWSQVARNGRSREHMGVRA